MASILPVGERWRAQVRRAGSKSIAKTFDTRNEAEQWARQIETELHHQRVAVSATMNLSSMIREYRRLREELGRPIDPASNTNYMLQHLEDDLGHERVEDLTPKRMAQWARARKEQGAGGYTVNMELSQLGTVLRHTSSFLQINVPDIVGSARPLLRYGQLITGGARRSRRPTQDELESLLAWLQQRNPIVADAVRVAAVTGLRRSELARIAWADLDEKQRAVLVRQRKRPRKVVAQDEWVPLLGESWEVVQRQPRTTGEPRIFPVSRETLTDSVTAGTRALGIADLRLHDIRREATSALREHGLAVDARKAVAGHKSDETHSRHVKVDLSDLHRQYDAAQDTR